VCSCGLKRRLRPGAVACALFEIQPKPHSDLISEVLSSAQGAHFIETKLLTQMTGHCSRVISSFDPFTDPCLVLVAEQRRGAATHMSRDKPPKAKLHGAVITPGAAHTSCARRHHVAAAAATRSTRGGGQSDARTPLSLTKENYFSPTLPPPPQNVPSSSSPSSSAAAASPPPS
jgi:hypothetical protein